MYEKYFGLHLKPFENTPDPRFLFPSRSHREILASLRYGVDNAKGFILISGGIGTGKSTMISALLQDIDSSFITFNIVNPKWTFTEIISYLAVKLKISVENKNGLQIIEDLQSALEKLDYHGKSVVLIIDEAHLVAESTLEDIRLLSNIEKHNKKLIQIIIVGQDEIYQTLQKDSLKTLKQRIVINRHLEPLSKNESKFYVNHRLRVAGGKSQIFNEKALSLIWKRSRGVPRLINHICDNAMLIGYASGINKIGAKVIKEVIHDMDSGHKNLKEYKFLQLRNLKWAGALAAFIILIALIAAYFIHYKPMDLIINNGLQAESGSTHQSEKQSVSEEPVVKAPMANLELQEPLPQQPAKHAELVTPAEPDQSIIVSENDISNKDAVSDSTPAARVEEPKSQTAAGLLPDEPLIMVKKADAAPLEKPKGQTDRSPLSEEPVITGKPAEKLILVQKVVKPNDNLSKIARETYGLVNDTIIDLIQVANSSIKSIDRIYVGQTILLPDIKRENLISFDQSGSYHIHYASFYSLDDATKCVEELRRKDQNSIVIPTQQQENKVYRVYHGKFKSFEEARTEIEDLQFKYLTFLN